ncbi:MAG TPA: hypothetical protein VL551_22075 [Actinospica sp.]|jgi:hypothetical protein|nr:hypothetical protein [Actinospica sp.]
MATRKKPVKRKPAARKSGTVRRAGLADIRRWWKRKTRRARKRVAKKLHLTTTTKKMSPTPPPKRRTAQAAGPGLRTLGGKTVNAGPTAPAGTTAVHTTTGKAAPMTQRIKRSKGGQFNGSTAAKKTAAGKKTVAPNPEQQRLLAANKKAAQIDARIARAEQRIDRMFPDTGAQSEQSAADSTRRTGTPGADQPRESTTSTTRVVNINNGGTVGRQGADIVGETVVITSSTHRASADKLARAKRATPVQSGKNNTASGNDVVGVQAGHIEGSAVHVNGKRVQQRREAPNRNQEGQ